MALNKLPPIWNQLTEETKDFKAHSETKELQFRKCLHKDLTISNGELRCRCGVGYVGSGLHELEKLLLSR